MTITFKGRVENGVVVLKDAVKLPEHEWLTFTVDIDTPADPVPENGPELMDWFARHRIILPPEQARDFAESDEHLIQDGDDAP